MADRARPCMAHAYQDLDRVSRRAGCDYDHEESCQGHRCTSTGSGRTCTSLQQAAGEVLAVAAVRSSQYGLRRPCFVPPRTALDESYHNGTVPGSCVCDFKAQRTRLL